MADNIIDLQDRLSSEEAATFLKVSISTIISWRFKRVGPPYLRVGKKIFYRRGDLIQWLEGCLVDPEGAI